MTFEQSITKQIQRFFHLPGAEREDETRATAQAKELRHAFRQACSTVELVEIVGDRVLLNAKYFPLPADVMIAADEIAESRRVKDYEPQSLFCDSCNGTGFISKQHDGAWFATPCCKCWTAAR